MKNILYKLIVLLLLVSVGCQSGKQNNNNNADKAFTTFEDSFLDAYWKQYPSNSIYSGYGKYYDRLVIPDSSAFAGNISFSNNWIDSLSKIGYDQLSENNKISFKIIRNQLQADTWYTAVFKQQEWDASFYNISGPSDYIINQPYAPLDERLKILTRYLQHTDDYYKAALNNLHQPTKEHLELSIMQNQAGTGVFGAALSDSINASHLTEIEKDSLHQNINKSVAAMNAFTAALKKIVADKNYTFRSFRIGKKLFDEKFRYDIVTDLTAEQVYAKAVADKQLYHQKMFVLADGMWSKYYATLPKPKDSLQLVQFVLNKIQLNHPKPADFFNTVKNQVYELKKFILEKKLFDFDTNAAPITTRYMPGYARGVTLASAEFIPPYQKQGATYYNVDDLTLYTPEKAESALRETNEYSSQILSMHEAVPGHCMQGIYNNKKSPDVVRSVFQNGAMTEGWAVYIERMMVENGWGNHAPEMELVLDVLELRSVANTMIDYEMQCLNKPEKEIVQFLSKECFQTDAQVKEKYHRATVSQVQLCSYYTGATAILSLRDEYKKKMGDRYSLKDFHEVFLSFGSSPVKYIRESMLR
ncbi:MAG: DUF885 domain-containing protein [Bacteroidota bacterium]